jgi:hypothetical protein
MLDQIFNHFILIEFLPGNMGTFLSYFLTPDIKENSDINLSKSADDGMMANYEWKFSDAFDGFFVSGDNKYTDLVTLLSKTYSAPDVYKVAALIIMNTKYYIMKNDITCDEKSRMDLMLEFAKNPFDSKVQIPFDILKQISSRYIKTHPWKGYPGIDKLFSSVKWGNKVIRCEFPNEKSWIAFYLLKYKFLNSNRDYAKPVLDNLLAKTSTLSDVSFIRFFCYNKYKVDVYNTNEYFDFDIYDLVINKNLKQVYEIDPNFEFTETKKDMLELAHSSTIKILNYFNLDHRISIDTKTSVKQVNELETKHRTLM